MCEGKVSRGRLRVASTVGSQTSEEAAGSILYMLDFGPPGVFLVGHRNQKGGREWSWKQGLGFLYIKAAPGVSVVSPEGQGSPLLKVACSPGCCSPAHVTLGPEPGSAGLWPAVMCTAGTRGIVTPGLCWP